MSAETIDRLTDQEREHLLSMLERLLGGRLPERCLVLVTINDDQVAARPYVLWRERGREREADGARVAGCECDMCQAEAGALLWPSASPGGGRSL